MISSKLERLVEAKECLAIAVDTVVELSQVLRPHLLLEVGWGTRLSGTERCAVISLTNSSGDDFCNRLVPINVCVPLDYALGDHLGLEG